MADILLFNKPFNVLCQFTDDEEFKTQRKTLADYINQPNFYAAGRLDRDSEGLLILTNDGKLQQAISNPKTKQPKTYLVQVEGEISREAIQQLVKGVKLKDGLTRPAIAKRSRNQNGFGSETHPLESVKTYQLLGWSSL